MFLAMFLVKNNQKFICLMVGQSILALGFRVSMLYASVEGGTSIKTQNPKLKMLYSSMKIEIFR